MSLSYSFYIDTFNNSAYIIYGEFKKYPHGYTLECLEFIWNLVDDKIEEIKENTEIYENIKINLEDFRHIYSTFEKAYHMLIYYIFFSSKNYKLLYKEKYNTCQKLQNKIKFTDPLIKISLINIILLNLRIN